MSVAVATAVLPTPQTNSNVVKVPSKKIDLGAAANFGKKDLGINSPTHKNTHAEEIFSPNNNTKQIITTNNIHNNNGKTNSNDILEDLFQTSDSTLTPPSARKTQNKLSDDFDDFNPRAEEATEFGDFASAFGAGGNNKSNKNIDNDKLNKAKTANKIDEFADFSSAFTGSKTITSNSNNANNLFGTSPIINQTQQVTTATVSPLSNLDLLGGNIESLIGVNNQKNTGNMTDLLSDFGGININTANGEFLLIFFFFNFT